MKVRYTRTALAELDEFSLILRNVTRTRRLLSSPE